ncbi:sialidase [Streptomyces sp. NPDC013455]|uniref:RCC1-like domain-containing protein n=1 Tax=Streptomyces sp. NPDC013455 TaxID=3155605 RepID=UPI0033D65C45
MNAKSRGLRLRAALTVIATATALGAAAAPALPAEGHDPLVYAWGANKGGQLGNSTTIDRYAPAAIPSLPKQDVFKIAPGGGVTGGTGFAVALRNDGSVWTWGQSDKGQLGTGPASETVKYQSGLGKVPGLNGIVDVAAGGQHALALRVNTGKADGVYAWGLNDKGQVGEGTNANRSVPKLVQSMHGGKQVAAGCNHSMLLTENNTVKVWGANEKGQLGLGDKDTANHNTPVDVPDLTNVVKIAAGCDYSLAVKSDGTVWAWGDNTHGQLGVNKDKSALASSNKPVQVQGLPASQAGQGNPTDQSGGTGSGTGTGTAQGTGPGLLDIAAGWDHAYALYSDNKVYGWGSNGKGQLADGTTDDRTSAHEATQLPPVKSIAAGYNGGVAVRTAGSGTSNDIIGWGVNTYGQLGSGDTSEHNLTNNDKYVTIFAQEAETTNPFTRVAMGSDETVYAY